jgi:hypothetical protein
MIGFNKGLFKAAITADNRYYVRLGTPYSLSCCATTCFSITGDQEFLVQSELCCTPVVFITPLTDAVFGIRADGARLIQMMNQWFRRSRCERWRFSPGGGMMLAAELRGVG